MLVIGLTGSMASGKSTVAAMLRKAKVPVIDADDLAREVCRPGSPALKKIVSYFGESVLKADQSLDRTKLAAVVFSNQEALRELENIVHPYIGELYQKLLAEYRTRGTSAVVYMAPLLFEKNLVKQVDKTILITAPKTTLIKRAQTRDNMSKTDAKARLQAQMSNKEKKKLADEVIENNGSLDDLFLQLKLTWKRLCNMDLKH